MTTTFDTLSAAAHSKPPGSNPNRLKLSSAPSGPVEKHRSQRPTCWPQPTNCGGEMKAMAAELRGEISSAVNKMLLAQLAIAGLLFAALRIFG